MPSDHAPPTSPTGAPASPTSARPPAAPSGDVYATIRRFAPALVVVFCAGLLLVVALVRPFPSPAPAIELHDALVGSEGDPVAAYVVIHNTGGNDTLLGASTPAATTVELQERETSEADPAGVLVTVDHLDVPGYADTRLQPGSDQLLLRGLTRPLAVGDTVPLTLDFERAGTLTVHAQVRTYLDIADQLLPPRLVVPGQDGAPAQPGQ